MAERIYLQDWFYNAGIVGLLRILGGEVVKNGRLLSKGGAPIDGVRIGENFIEVEKELFKDFAHKYYIEAAKREIEISNIDGLNLGEDESSLKRLRSSLDWVLKNLFTHIKEEIELPKVSKKNLEEIRKSLEEVFLRIKEEKEKLSRGELPLSVIESLARRWLRRGFFSSGGSNKLYEALENLKEKLRFL